MNRALGNDLGQEVSPYNACLHEVAIGSTDICIAPTWSTMGRRKMTGQDGTTFSSDITTDTFHLIAPAQRVETDFVALVGKPFAVFEWQLWLLLFASVTALGESGVVADGHACAREGCLRAGGVPARVVDFLRARVRRAAQT